MLHRHFPNRLVWSVLLCLAFGMSAMPAHARYLRPDLVEIPVDRLITNLEEATKNADEKEKATTRALFNLARVHAMAYALKTDKTEVRKGSETEPWFGFEPAHVPFRVKPTDDEEKLKIAKAHLAAAISNYEKVVKAEPKNLTAQLGHAWCIDQSGDRDKAIKLYREVIEEAWKTERELKRAGLGWHSVTAEAAGYLIPLLDAEKDKEEIDELKSRVTQVRKLPRPVTPIVVPLRDGLTAADLENHDASVAFDADGTGLKKNWSWITQDAGWLVFDQSGSGKITSGLQLFGNVTFWTFWDNGYEALAALDDNHDGKLEGAELKGLAIWHDRNGDGISDAGEVKPLAEWNIVALSCRFERDADHADKIPFSPQGVTFQDGTTRATYDIILKPRP